MGVQLTIIYSLSRPKLDQTFERYVLKKNAFVFSYKMGKVVIVFRYF
jgi:hypothetical protein